MVTLVGLHYSPWTEKARFALDHHRVPYRYEEHLLIFGMPWLRLRLGRIFGDVTVPALIASDAKLCDSYEIARYADGVGEGEPLFPEGLGLEIERCNAMSEAALDAGRALLMHQMWRDPEAQADALPSFVPGFLRRPLRAIASVGLKYIDLAFGVSRTGVGERESAIRKILLDFRAALGGREYLVGDRFTFADIALAGALHAVRPPSDEYVPMRPGVRRCWTQAGLVTEFQDLLDWRDRLYRTRRLRQV